MTQTAPLPPVSADLDFPVYTQDQVSGHFCSDSGQGTLTPRHPAHRPYLHTWPASEEGQQISSDQLTGLEHWTTIPPDKYVSGWTGLLMGRTGATHQITVTVDCHEWDAYARHPAWGEAQVSLDCGNLWTSLPLRYLGGQGVRQAVMAMTTPGQALDEATMRASRMADLYARVQATRDDGQPEAEDELHRLLNTQYRDVSHPQTLTALNGQDVWIDDRIREAVARLNQNGHTTTFCCQGDPETGGAYMTADTLPPALLSAAFNAGLDVRARILRDTGPAHLQAGFNAAFLAILDDYVTDSLDETGLKYRTAFDLPALEAYPFTLREVVEI